MKMSQVNLLTIHFPFTMLNLMGESSNRSKIGTLLIVGVIIIVLLIVLNQLKIINLANPKSLLTVNKQNQIKGGEVSSQLQVRAQKAGYKLVYQGDSVDLVGRTVLADGKRSEELFPEKFGWQSQINRGLNLSDYSMGFGIFKEFKQIAGSKDVYIYLTNPSSKSTETSTLIGRINEKTVLNVQELNYGFRNRGVSPISQFDLFNKIAKDKLKKILKPGDVVEIYTIPLTRDEAKSKKRLIMVDSVGNPYAFSIAIRRFGGIDQVGLEL
jgi:hypothetical protein